MEEDVPGEHGGDAGDLLLLVHEGVARRVGLEVERHAARHPGQDAEQVPGLGLPGQYVAQRLHEPGPRRRVAPRVEARDGAVGDEEVGVRRDLVAVRRRVRLRRVRHHLDAGVELVALTGLDEEKLGLAGQGRALLRVEVGPQAVGLERLVRRVEDALLAWKRITNKERIKGLATIFNKNTCALFTSRLLQLGIYCKRIKLRRNI